MVKNAQNRTFSAFVRKLHIGFPYFLHECQSQGVLKSDVFVFFRKTRKLDILGCVCQKFEPKWSKMPKIEGFPHFSKTAYWISLIFCMNASLRECKKVTFFQENSKIGHFGPSLSKIGTFMAFQVSPEMGVLHFLCVAHASDPA